MQYSRIFERGRLPGVALLGLAVLIGTISSADAARRHHRSGARPAAVARDGGDDVGSSARYAAYVVDDKTGRVLFSKNADAPRHPASLTKMMTLYILFEELDKRRFTMNSRLVASQHSSNQAPSKLGLRPGQTIAVEDAIRALVTKSANDVAVTVAENIGGSESAFAKRMNRTARRIGMPGTTFYNASGLPNAAQYTTARDMVTLGRALQERFPAYYRYFSTRSFAWGDAVHGNHNKLLYRLEGIDGIKTGYTDASGFNLVSSIWRDNRHLVASVMGGSSARARDDHMVKLLSSNLAAASSGSKVSSVFKENGVGRQSDADDGEDDATQTASTPAQGDVPTSALALAPTEAAAPPTPSPATSSLPSRAEAANKPRIGTSDIVALTPRAEATKRTSDDRGAAVAMARAILLPDSSHTLPTQAATSVRTASTAPVPVMPVSLSTSVSGEDPKRPRSLAEATISTADVAALTTASVPRVETVDPTPAPTSTRSGWMVQIGAYDREEAAKASIAKAKDQAGTALAQADGFTESVGASGHLWRARFAGFRNQTAAESACRALKRKDFACLALRQ